MAKAELPSNQEFPPRPTKEEYLQNLGFRNQQNVSILLENVLSAVPLITKAQYEVYAIGSTVFPAKFRDHDPDDIDLRVVINRAIDVTELNTLTRRIKQRFNKFVGSDFGSLEKFDAEDHESSPEMRDVGIRLLPKFGGKAIDVFLPEANPYMYDNDAGTNTMQQFRKIRESAWKKLTTRKSLSPTEREGLIHQAYVVKIS